MPGGKDPGYLWSWARTAYLVAGALALVLIGGGLLIGEQAIGLIYVGCGLVVLIFLPRRGATAFAALVVAANGLIEGRPWQFGLALLGTALAALVTSKPPPNRRPDGAPSVSPDDLLGRAGLVIQSLGTLRLMDAGIDHAGWLLRRPALSFVWLFLLARLVVAPADRTTREQLGLQMNPLLHGEQQKERVRKRLSSLRRTLPSGLATTVAEDEELIWLDLSRVDCDVVRLMGLRDEVAHRGGLLDEDLTVEVEGGLQRLGWGEFLPIWEDVHQRQNGGHGDAGDVVTDARRAVDTARADLVVALADAHLARKQATRVVDSLEKAFERCPEREDVMTRLAAAYMATGQLARAKAVQASYNAVEVH